MGDNNQKKRICYYCDGTGKFKKPNDEDKFDKRFSYYENKGHFISTGEAREKALNDVGYTLVTCPVCGGSGEGKQ